MLTPSKLTELNNNKVVELYEMLNQEITNEIINKIVSDGDITNYTKKQIKHLASNGGKEIFNSSLEKTQMLTSARKKELKVLFNDMLKTEMKGYKKTFERAGKTYEVTDNMIRLVNSVIRQKNANLKNLTGTIAYASNQAYVEAMNDIYAKVATGTSDYESSLKKTINELATSGVTLKTAKGTKEKIEVAVRRDLFDGLRNTANDIAKEVGDIIGYNCVVIGHSYRCRPDHHPIDDVVMSKEEFKKYEYLTQEPNCYHLVNYDWQEEFEDKNLKVIYGKDHGTLQEVKINYEKHQKARYYERQVRDKKRAIANGDTSDEAKLALRKAQSKYKTYCNSVGLKPEYDRTQIPINTKNIVKENKKYKDITDEWLKNSDKSIIKIEEAKYVVKNGVKYETNKTNVIEYKNKEKENGIWYVELMGGKLQYLPTIAESGGVSCSDYLYTSANGKIQYFLEEKETSKKGKNIFYHALEDKENQSNIFLIDCTNSNLTNEEINSRIERVFTSKKTQYVETIIIKNGQSLYGVFNKNK